jgi:hypothetical protein
MPSSVSTRVSAPVRQHARLGTGARGRGHAVAVDSLGGAHRAAGARVAEHHAVVAVAREHLVLRAQPGAQEAAAAGRADRAHGDVGLVADLRAGGHGRQQQRRRGQQAEESDAGHDQSLGVE